MSEQEILTQLTGMRDKAKDNADSEVLDYAINAIKELQERRKADRWVPLAEKLPPAGKYLVSCGALANCDEYVEIARFDGRYFGGEHGFMPNAEAWKPMPEPYKEA